MKHLFLSVAFAAICLCSYANVITVNNHNPGPGQYNSLTTAFSAASAGDTLYLSGSPTSYGILTVTKQITIIGTGFNPTDKQDNSISTIGTITLNGGNNSSFIGLEISSGGGNGFTLPGSVLGLSVIRCLITGNTSMINSSIAPYDLTNLTIIGCQILNEPLFQGPASGSMTITNATISNNLINSNGVGFVMGLNCSFTNVNVLNNDFYLTGANPIPLANTFTNCTINNNLLMSTSSSPFTNQFINGNNDYVSNNIIDLNGQGQLTQPDFYTAFYVYGNEQISIRFVNPAAGDFHLQTGSPAINFGTDGTDDGMYGGSSGNGYVDTGEPAIPVIRSITAPATGSTGGTVNVNVISTRKQ